MTKRMESGSGQVPDEQVVVRRFEVKGGGLRGNDLRTYIGPHSFSVPSVCLGVSGEGLGA